MLVVLTNDDGCDAPGLAALHQAACALGDVEIDIIAPDGAISQLIKSELPDDWERTTREAAAAHSL